MTIRWMFNHRDQAEHCSAPTKNKRQTAWRVMKHIAKYEDEKPQSHHNLLDIPGRVIHSGAVHFHGNGFRRRAVSAISRRTVCIGTPGLWICQLRIPTAVRDRWQWKLFWSKINDLRMVARRFGSGWFIANLDCISHLAAYAQEKINKSGIILLPPRTAAWAIWIEQE